MVVGSVWGQDIIKMVAQNMHYILQGGSFSMHISFFIVQIKFLKLFYLLECVWRQGIRTKRQAERQMFTFKWAVVVTGSVCNDLLVWVGRRFSSDINRLDLQVYILFRLTLSSHSKQGGNIASKYVLHSWRRWHFLQNTKGPLYPAEAWISPRGEDRRNKSMHTDEHRGLHLAWSRTVDKHTQDTQTQKQMQAHTLWFHPSYYC